MLRLTKLCTTSSGAPNVIEPTAPVSTSLHTPLPPLFPSLIVTTNFANLQVHPCLVCYLRFDSKVGLYQQYGVRSGRFQLASGRVRL